ncbi:MAG: hypothetical protein CMP12_21225 [Zunongwangia sp.]|uniref:Phage protein n=1 Tax=Zunongwangia profunda TaxID=398743 RepID=A0A3D5IV74_9FLAO|nr:hypothetical protein [Zunongwangia profunda]MAO38381.1 hypothetical protein [Zunongwangia sp.]MAS70876.1 hypothetical protein [Zunongwangia sp.]HCV79687.1 hypothetical protein [Zunongwangia profunda]|tara:strand:- start:4572 stop:4826 length:255 start_codon:yes stop_codon:yes gene_type:complete
MSYITLPKKVEIDQNTKEYMRYHAMIQYRILFKDLYSQKSKNHPEYNFGGMSSLYFLGQFFGMTDLDCDEIKKEVEQELKAEEL